MTEARRSQNNASERTQRRVLRAAESIFARGGFRAMTLRQVTEEAGVNLAAVNYHFGSKTDLMRAIVRRRFEPINQRRIERLEGLVQQHGADPVPLEAIFDALFRPLFVGLESTPARDVSLIQLMGRAFTEPAEFMRNLHQEFFVDLSRRFLAEIARSCPDLSADDIQYRFFFAVSTMIGTVIEQVRLETVSGGKLEGGDLDRTLQEMIAFVVRGFQQP